jgi:hypothetical protein
MTGHEPRARAACFPCGSSFAPGEPRGKSCKQFGSLTASCHRPGGASWTIIPDRRPQPPRRRRCHRRRNRRHGEDRGPSFSRSSPRSWRQASSSRSSRDRARTGRLMNPALPPPLQTSRLPLRVTCRLSPPPSAWCSRGIVPKGRRRTGTRSIAMAKPSGSRRGRNIDSWTREPCLPAPTTIS